MPVGRVRLRPRHRGQPLDRIVSPRLKMPAMSSTPVQFVVSLKADTRASVESTIEYLRASSARKPPEPLQSLGLWFRGLGAEDQAMVRTAMTYAAEGSLFGVLSVLDGVSSARGVPGQYELYHVSDGSRTRLNDPDGDFLHDLFNELP